MTGRDECQHGSLRRACALCDALAEIDEYAELADRMSDILSRTAIALRGPEPKGTRWGWHDLPERAAAAVSAIGVMQRAAAALAADEDRPLVEAADEIKRLRAVAQHETDAAEAYRAQAESLRTRIESLRGSLKSAAGWLLDAGDLEHAAWCRDQAGDMEPRP